MEVDHIYICTEANAPAGDLLVEFGLVEGSANKHPGQGTASRRFFFHNFMLELLWVENMEEVKNERTKPMRLYKRCLAAEDLVSPFGISIRPTAETENAAPFPSWDYHPVYLPDFLKIEVAENTPLSEPMYFYQSFAKRQDIAPKAKLEPMEHGIPLREITSVKIHVKHAIPISEAAAILNRLQEISIEKGEENLLELEFDNVVHSQSKDFSPHLPLIIKW